MIKINICLFVLFTESCIPQVATKQLMIFGTKCILLKVTESVSACMCAFYPR